MVKVKRVICIKQDKFWKLYGYKEEELREIMDDDQPYAIFLTKDGMKQTLELTDGEIVDTYINLGTNEAPYKVGDTWSLK